MVDYSLLNFLLILLIETLFFVLMLYSLFKLNSKASGPMFERSGYLMIVSNFSNFIEIVLNIICGYSSYISKKIGTTELVLFNLIIFTSRFYACCTLLRMVRIMILHKFRNGEISRISFTRLSSFKVIYFLCFSYAGLSLLIISMIVFQSHLSPSLLPYFNNSCYLIESTLFLVLSLIVLQFKIHPSLSVEYFIYSLLWFTGGFEYKFQYQGRWLFEIPIRNNVLVLISFLSLKIDAESQRPPLPVDLEILEIFEIEELYYAFLDFTKKQGNDQQICAVNTMKELAKGSFYENYEVINVRGTELKELFDPSYRELLEESMYDDLKMCMVESLEEIFQQFKDSGEFSSFRRKYFIDFN